MLGSDSTVSHCGPRSFCQHQTPRGHHLTSPLPTSPAERLLPWSWLSDGKPEAQRWLSGQRHICLRTGRLYSGLVLPTTPRGFRERVPGGRSLARGWPRAHGPLPGSSSSRGTWYHLICTLIFLQESHSVSEEFVRDTVHHGTPEAFQYVFENDKMNIAYIIMVLF